MRKVDCVCLCACVCASVCECVCMCLTSASVTVKWSKCLRLDSNNTLLPKETTSMLIDYLLYQNAEHYNSGNCYVDTNAHNLRLILVCLFFCQTQDTF